MCDGAETGARAAAPDEPSAKSKKLSNGRCRRRTAASSCASATATHSPATGGGGIFNRSVTKDTLCSEEIRRDYAEIIVEIAAHQGRPFQWTNEAAAGLPNWARQTRGEGKRDKSAFWSAPLRPMSLGGRSLTPPISSRFCTLSCGGNEPQLFTPCRYSTNIVGPLYATAFNGDAARACKAFVKALRLSGPIRSWI